MEERFKTFTVLIAGISRSIRRIKTGEMAEFHLKSPHVSCLYYLYKAGPLTARELCDICEEDKANISRSIRFLEENGLLTCHSKTQKRYQSPLCLTEQGTQVARQIAGKIDRVLDMASEGLSEENRQIFYQSLALIHANLQKICEQYTEDFESLQPSDTERNSSDDQ